MSKQGFDYLGKLSPEIAKYCKLNEHKNKTIVMYDDRREHVINRHLEDFGSIEKIDFVISKLRVIIKKPDMVFYNKKTKGLEFYKNIGTTNNEKSIVIAIRINSSKILKVRSFYPVSASKIKNRKKQETKKFYHEKRAL